MYFDSTMMYPESLNRIFTTEIGPDIAEKLIWKQGEMALGVWIQSMSVSVYLTSTNFLGATSFKIDKKPQLVDLSISPILNTSFKLSIAFPQ